MSISILDQISIGNLIEMGILATGWIVTIVKIDQRLKSVETEIKDVVSLTRWRERMEERISGMRREIDDLRRGRGFIRETDGEYLHDSRVRDAGDR